MKPARWWTVLPSGRLRCDLCPRACTLAEGQRGACRVRERIDDRLWTHVYGGVSSLAVDPIEKKPFFHVLPGSPVLSLGTLGCTLACSFCQNATISQSFRDDPLRFHPMTPESIVGHALDMGCPSVAFTYNEPLVSAEWTLDVARACRNAGLRTWIVTSGYVQPAPLVALIPFLDGANVDLKAFSEEFYRRYARGNLAPILDTLRTLLNAGRWLEITTLIIPGINDSEREIRALAGWIRDHLRPEVPLHLTAFHPAHRMLDRPPTPTSTLQQARHWARNEGLRFVYTGNLVDPEGQSTHCPTCGALLVARDRYRVRLQNLHDGHCGACHRPIPGRWSTTPWD